MRLDERIAAIVTGGASGLGRATARALRERGVRVAILDVDAARGEQTAKELGVSFAAVDVTQSESISRGFELARATNGQERILVNCAGIGTGYKTVWRDKTTAELRAFPIEAFVRMVDVNLIGTFRCIQVSALGMLSLAPLDEGDRGCIVNTASVAAFEGQVGQAAYSASKGGILSMTLPIARDLMSEAIRVNSIVPGLFDTPLMNAMPEPVKRSLEQQVCFPKRIGRPDEYAALVLAVLENGYINGERIRIDGGIRMAAH